jgi:hypothetical protein
MASCDDSNLRIWNRVPDKSKLEVSVVGDPQDPTNDQFVANAEVRVTGSPPAEWQDQSLRPGPKVEALKKPKGYNLTVRIAFAAKDSAQVQARVIKPDGSVYGKAYCYEIAGNAGDIATCDLIAVTVKR